MKRTLKIGQQYMSFVFTSSGTRGFAKEGYWWHWPLILFLHYWGATFVSKTATADLRIGNMMLTKCSTPRDWFPDCIKVYWFLRLVMNAVGLSNPGLEEVLRLQERRGLFKKPGQVVISVTSVASTKEERLAEYRRIKEILEQKAMEFVSILIEVNLFCPNTGADPHHLLTEGSEILDIFAPEFKVMLNVGPTANMKLVAEIVTHETCVALSICNTIAYNELPTWLQKQVKPLHHAPTGGGLSGWPLLAFTAQAVCDARDAGVTKPIIAGGGITNFRDIVILSKCGADAFKLGTMGFFSAWKVLPMIIFANWYGRNVQVYGR